MTELENEEIKHQIYLEQYKTGRANKVIALVDQADKEISKYIKQTDGVYTKERYKEVSKKLKEISKALKENIDSSTDIDGIIDYELRKQKQFLEDLDVDLVYPTVEQIKTSALFTPVVENVTYQSYLDGIETGLYNVWDSHVRTGYLTGQTTNEIVREVMGSVAGNAKVANTGAINAFRNSVYNNTRTVLQSFANETRTKVYEKNEQYFGDEKGYKFKYLATLDSRSCLVCGRLDGKKYKDLKDVPKLPQHYNCRCVIVPVLDIDFADERASANGYVSSKVTYSDWLKGQSEEVQKDVLGETRYKMYKGGETINSFVQNDKILTLKELSAKLGT